MIFRASLVSICFAFFGLAMNALAQDASGVSPPPIEYYGKRSEIRSVSLSPSGEKIAFIMANASTNGKEVIVTYSAAEGLQPIIDVSKLDGNSVTFIDEEHVVIRGYENTRVRGYRGRLNYSGGFAVNLKNKNPKALLKNTDNLYPAQSGLGQISGRLSSGELLMPAYTGTSNDNVGRSLFRVNMKSGKGRRFDSGTKHTLEWLVSREGEVLARADMHDNKDKFTLYTEQGGKSRVLFEEKDTARPTFDIVGIMPDESGIVLYNVSHESSAEYLKIDFGGKITPLNLLEPGEVVDYTFKDDNRKLIGVQYAGMLPDYKFFDSNLQAAVDHILTQLPNTRFDIQDISDDGSVVLARIFSSAYGEQYGLLDVATKKLNLISPARPDIPVEALGDVYGIETRARDGRTIPSILTLPMGDSLETVKNRPTIVMPHGGPRSYDSVDFDFMAQYFASRGFLVLQPNFRGSTGFGDEHMFAGNGEWGGKMQDDVTDGLQSMINDGFTDPSRVCIIGWSYGGYSALAGGAFTPDKYKCVLSIAGVSDLPKMLAYEKRDHGRSSYILDYWQEMIGDPKTQKDLLEAKSPVTMRRHSRHQFY